MSATVLRQHHSGRFTVLGNETLRDADLSFRARGILVYLLSLPNGVPLSVESITDAGTEGREAIRKAMTELDTVGYIARRRERNGDGHLRTMTYVRDGRDLPWPWEGAVQPELPDDGFPGPGATSTDTTKPQVGPAPRKPSAGERDDNRSTSQKEQKTAPPSRAGTREPFPEYDALVDVWGKPGTRQESAFYARVARGLREQGKPVDEIRARAERARQRFSDCTPNVLLERWNLLDPPAARRRTADLARFD